MFPVIDVIGAIPNHARPVVLVVDDEALLRMLAVDVVEQAGCTALEAGDADEAIALLEAIPDISVLFTDIHMPGRMDGLKLAHVVRQRWPAIGIIVVSGLVRPGPYELPSNSCFFCKPYETMAMIAELRSLAGLAVAGA
ncbi:MAG: response regulator receiver [Xanthobacteraceae bacterium]|nr:response regulator receiver [Xanthobacteraceae bacterium]